MLLGKDVPLQLAAMEDDDRHGTLSFIWVL